MAVAICRLSHILSSMQIWNLERGFLVPIEAAVRVEAAVATGLAVRSELRWRPV